MVLQFTLPWNTPEARGLPDESVPAGYHPSHCASIAEKYEHVDLTNLSNDLHLSNTFNKHKAAIMNYSSTGISSY